MLMTPLIACYSAQALLPLLSGWLQVIACDCLSECHADDQR